MTPAKAQCRNCGDRRRALVMPFRFCGRCTAKWKQNVMDGQAKAAKRKFASLPFEKP